MSERFCFLNGRIMPAQEIGIPVLDRGFLYGDGLFETLKGEHGRVHLLNRHLARLRKSCTDLNLPFPDDVDWERVLSALFEANGLTENPCTVKIILTRGIAQGRGLPKAQTPTLLIIIQPHPESPPEAYVKGMAVTVFPLPWENPLAEHKTLAYLNSLVAREYAYSRGLDEILLVNSRGFVTEASGSSLVWVEGETVFGTPGPGRLPGVTEAALRDALVQCGVQVGQREIRADELPAADAVFLTNSLMGVMPVTRLDTTDLRKPGYAEKAAEFNALLAGQSALAYIAGQRVYA
jgi:branched-subunit amino acid aminotransferase/4-amino-4-deoxychorismate lyase